MATETTYYVLYPRDFANEYTVHAVPAGQAGRFERLFPAAKPITKGEALRLGWFQPAAARAAGDHQWYGGFCGGRGDGGLDGPIPATTREALERCEQYTLAAIDRMDLLIPAVAAD